MKYNVTFYFNKPLLIDHKINIIDLFKESKLLEYKRTAPDYMHHIPMISYLDLNDIEFTEIANFIQAFPYKQFIIEVKIKFR